MSFRECQSLLCCPLSSRKLGLADENMIPDFLLRNRSSFLVRYIAAETGLYSVFGLRLYMLCNLITWTYAVNCDMFKFQNHFIQDRTRHAFIFVVEKSSNYSKKNQDVHKERKLKGWKYLAEFDVEKRALRKD